ncbi:MAG: alpha/beta fold hydrolase [Chloroflexota bacterium]
MSSKFFIFIVLLILVVCVVVWFGVRSRQHQEMLVPPGAKAGDFAVSPGVYKTKTMTYQAETGILIVPENRANPATRLIAIPVKRIRSASANPAEPIFYLAGGPGSSNMGFKPGDALLAEHDVVIVGYRGADGSVVLHCPEMNKASTGDGRDIFSATSMDAMRAALQACAARLQAEGVDLAGYTIPEVVADMEAARLALGYERINLLSESYGTRVAQVYAYLHPQRLLRSAMIGVNPPGRFVWEPQIIDEQLQYVSALCKKDAACSQRTPDLYVSMQRVSRNMPRQWLGIPIDRGKVEILAFVLLYHRSTSPLVFDAYLAAEKGDTSGLALMSLAYDRIMPNIFTWGDLLSKGTIDYDPMRDYTATLQRGETVLGSPGSLLIWGPGAAAWPITFLPAAYSQVHPSEVQTLLINGSMDFSTPLENGRDQLLPSLRNGRLVTLSEMGHVNDFWNINPSAAERLLTSFYGTGEADASLFGDTPMDFTVKLGFPAIAKLLVLLSGGLLIPAVWLGNRLRKRKR